ncbi:MAG: hypothetical protein ACI87E_001253 [Mariniblastus sp.]|jgi:hypothetical protein
MASGLSLKNRRFEARKMGGFAKSHQAMLSANRHLIQKAVFPRISFFNDRDQWRSGSMPKLHFRLVQNVAW